MRIVRVCVLLLCGLGFNVTSLHASPITLNFDFSATNPGPVNPVTGSFTLTFDNASFIADTTSGLSVTNLNIALNSAAAFRYHNSDDTLYIGGLDFGVMFVGPGTNDFAMAIAGASSLAPTVSGFVYRQSGYLSTIVASSTTLTPPQPAAVPEPASMLLLGTGLAGLAARRCRRSRS